MQFPSKPGKVSADTDKLTLKYVWKGKGIRIDETILKKKRKVGGIHLTDLQTYSTTIVTEIVWRWRRDRCIDPWNRIDYPETGPHNHSQQIFDKGVKQIDGGRLNFSTNRVETTRYPWAKINKQSSTKPRIWCKKIIIITQKQHEAEFFLDSKILKILTQDKSFGTWGLVSSWMWHKLNLTKIKHIQSMKDLGKGWKHQLQTGTHGEGEGLGGSEDRGKTRSRAGRGPGR